MIRPGPSTCGSTVYGTGLLRDEVLLYSHSVLESQTVYRVQIQGTYAGGDLDLSWTFSTE